MPPTFVKVEEASSQLVESTQRLSKDVHSKQGQALLIAGARGMNDTN